VTITSMSEEVLVEQIADILIAVHSISVGDRDFQFGDSLQTGPLADIAADIRELATNLAHEETRLSNYERDLRNKLDTVQRQRETISELSTPILEIWRGVLALPILGVVDTARSAEISDRLLTEISRGKSRFVIIDLTGVETMDTRTCYHFIQLARSARLLGADSALTGISPTMAHTIVQLGVDLASLTTYRTMKDALAHYLRTVAARRPAPVERPAATREPDAATPAASANRSSD
jgi:rsbT co-antagonist protein RsbR